MSAVDTLKSALYGNPPSPDYKPSKDGVLRAFEELASLVSLGALGVSTYATRADMNAVTPGANDPKVAIVNNDPVAANNNVYTFRNTWVIFDEYYKGISTVVQPIIDAALARLQDAPQVASDTDGNLEYLTDASGQVIRYTSPTGGMHLPGLPRRESVQSVIRNPSPRLLLPTFKPLAVAPPLSARYITAASERAFLPNPNSTAISAITFHWPPDPVGLSQIRLAQGNIGSTNFTLDEITLNEGPCLDYLRTHQIRDISTMYDRITGRYWHAINSIERATVGYVGSHFTLGYSTNKKDITLVGYVEIPSITFQVWSPEWVTDPDTGEVVLTVSVNNNAVIFNSGQNINTTFNYHILRVVDLNTARFDYVGQVSGSVFPRNSSGAINMIDPFMFKRNGVWTILWKSENNTGGNIPYGTLGWASSTNILGPYDVGRAFTLDDGSTIRGEGQHAYMKLDGSWRFGFDDFLNLYNSGTGLCYADTPDFDRFADGVKSIDGSTNQAAGSLGVYNRHSTFAPF